MEENRVVEIAFSFADEDLVAYQEIQKHLSTFQRTGQIHCWSHLDVKTGQETQKEIASHLETAQVIVLLLSPDYLASTQHYEIEAGIALHRQQAGQTHVIPLLIRPCSLADTPFARLQILPYGQLPVSTWSNADQAYEEITTRIKSIVQSIIPLPERNGNQQIWTVPYPRNPFFTGREVELQAIATTLSQGQNAAIGQTQAISGLGGVGKTQLALEYAYRHQQEYRYVFWVLADTRETLNAHYSQIAELLDLPGKNQAELRYIVEAVKSWFERNQDWLLILDNADNLDVLTGSSAAQDQQTSAQGQPQGIPGSFLPSNASGHILITTRSHVTADLAEKIEAGGMPEEEGISFLLRRSGLLKKREEGRAIDPKEREAAQKIMHELAGLPLALDQAGAYIEETSCGLQGYLSLYQTEHKALLKMRGKQHTPHHPDSVTQTIQLAFKKVEKVNPAAADLLRLCAFLAPEDIPELIIEQGEAEFSGPLKQLARKPLKLNAAIADLQKYSLITRHPATRTLDVHRLVQVVLHDSMTKNVEQAWATRVVRIINRVFPWPEVENWETCRQLLPHAQEAATLVIHWQIETWKSLHLLNSVGWYLKERAEYDEAQTYCEKALSSAQKVFGKGHVATSAYLNNLGLVYSDQGKYEQAASLQEQALAIRRNVFGDKHPDTAMSLDNLGLTYLDQGKYEQAASLQEQALAIRRKVQGEDHPGIAISLDNLGLTYRDQGKYEQAASLQEQALAIRRKVFGDEHPDTARSQGNLGLTYHEQGKYEQAARLHEQALAIKRKVFGDEHPDTAKGLNNLAEAYLALERYEEVEPLHQQALAILQKALGEEHPLVATSLNNRGELFLAQRRYEEAKDFFQHALTIQRKAWVDGEHPDTARSLHNLGVVSQAQGNTLEASTFFQQAWEMRRATLGEEHPKTRATLANYEEIAEITKTRE